MKTQLMLENANKLAYMIKLYPDRSLPEIIKLFRLPGVQINTAIWLATELGFISKPDEQEGAVRFLEAPQSWNFGDNVDNLKDMLVYAFDQLEKKQADLEENYFTGWVDGYAPHDIFIATRSLIDEGLIAEYTLVDDVQNDGSEYTFYTAARNRDKEWGRAQFAKAPESEATDTKPEMPEDETTTTTTVIPTTEEK